MNEQNGEPVDQAPNIEVAPAVLWKLEIGFSPKEQGVSIVKDDKQIKTWEMVIGILQMALAQANFCRNMGHGAFLQQRAIENAQQEAIARQLKERRPR